MISEIKKFLKHSFIYGIGALLSKIVGFLMIPIYTRYLTTTDYGILELLDLTSSIVSIFISMRIGAAVIRFYYDFDNEQEKKQVIGTAYISIFFSAILLIVISELTSNKISYLLFDTQIYEKYFKIIFITTALTLISSIPDAYLIARKQSLFYTFMSLISLVSNLSFNIYFIVFLKLGVLGVLYSSLITRLWYCPFLSIYCIYKNKLFFSFPIFKSMLKFSLPLIPANVGTFILNYADRFILQKLSITAEVGIYALGYKFGYMLPVLVMGPINMIWGPQMFELASKSEKKTIERMFTYIMLILIFCGLGLILFTKDAIRIMAAPPFYPAYKVVGFVVLGYIFRGMASFFWDGIMVSKKTIYIGISVFVSALSNILLNILLIPQFKGMGAAYATAVSFFIMFCLVYFFCQKVYPISCEWNRISKITIVSLFIFFLAHLVSSQNLIISLLIKIIFLVSFPVLLYFLGFYVPEEINKIRYLIFLLFNKLRRMINTDIGIF